MKVYMILFKETVTDDEIADYTNKLEESGGRLKYDYSPLMKAMAAWIPDDCIQSFSRDPIVESMEPDGIATTQG
ncbi:hypothetical protein RSOLAG1IB_07842 [Rhizoctonia solani AG-1 IB]|uniref:Inhibitor I9 domain-containing protein n=1 Tax=Thanatephorus cucumeris (strain AG1-IB / isolate 7/3/14) TaxID=1108050 RepID=A0A0B7FJT8_THACB|nr:hypothetical protein RSOLAG1IB_07842 [Rhizoctonia solani AG-1 IB]